MFGIGPLELIAVVVLALIVLGPERFPEAARGVGKIMGQIWSLRDEVAREIAQAVEVPKSPQRSPSAPESDVAGDVTLSPPDGQELSLDRSEASLETAASPVEEAIR